MADKRSLANDGYVNLNAKDKFGQTPLHIAAIGGHDQIVQKFIDHPRSNLDAQDDDGWTPLMSATQGQNTTIVRQLLSKSKMSIADKCGKTPLLEAMRKDDLEIVQILWDHLCNTSSPDLNTTDVLLKWASEDYKRHDFANSIMSRNDLHHYTSTDPPSAIVRAALSCKPGLLWCLIATSPQGHATKCVEQARKEVNFDPPGPRKQQRMAGARFITKRRGVNGNIIAELPGRQDISSVPTKGDVSSEIRDILENPPFEVAYRNDPIESVPQPEELTKDYRAHVRRFFKNQTASSTVCKVLSVEDVVYRQGPDSIMRERIQAEKKYMERRQPTTNTSSLYNEENCQFTWVHLPATRVCLPMT